ncbi:MAG: hypothetical protein JRI72_15770 [Deltaproteobacteria bacterium]|nr:hypothetical protein [Deltaproteobacteria bacterium]
MRAKNEILKPIKELCEGVTNDPEAAWHGYVEHAKLEVFLDIRDLLEDLAVAINEVDKTLCIVKKQA